MGYSFTPEDNAAMTALLASVSYDTNPEVDLKQPVAGDRPDTTDPDLTLDDVLERAGNTAPSDPAFQSVLTDARAVVAVLMLDNPHDERLTSVDAQLEKMQLVNWESLDSLFAGGADADYDETVCIMAVPADDDPCQNVGENDKHATLLYFGDISAHDDPTRMEAAKPWFEEVLGALTQKIPPFSATVTGIKALGDDDPPAQVWKLDSPNLRDLFGGIPAADDEIKELYDGADATRYPEFTAHVTIGYDDVPPEAAAIKEITFDRLSLWWGNEHIDFPLAGLPDTSEFEALFSLVASGFAEDQIRVPRGNGEQSGRWLDSPITILNQLASDLGETAVSDQAAERVSRATDTAKGLDARTQSADEISERLTDVAFDLDRARADAGDREARTKIENALDSITHLEGLDWSMYARESDIGYVGPDITDEQSTDIGAEPTDWNSMSQEDVLAATENAIADLFAAEDTTQIDAAVDAVYAGMTARIQAVLDGSLLPLTLRPNKHSYGYGSLDVGWVFEDKDGHKAGSLTRTIIPSDTSVRNEYFVIDPAYQNQGLSSSLALSLEDWYQANGVQDIYVHANIDVGGYTWAKAGFDVNTDQEDSRGVFQNALNDVVYELDGYGTGSRIFQQLYTDVALNALDPYNADLSLDEEGIDAYLTEMARIPGSTWETDPAWRKDLDLADQETRAKAIYEAYWEVLAASKVLSREEWLLRDQLMSWATGLRDDSGADPAETLSIYELATFGQGTSLERTDVQTIYDRGGRIAENPDHSAKTRGIVTWPGKRALLHSDWEGVKHIGDDSW